MEKYENVFRFYFLNKIILFTVLFVKRIINKKYRLTLHKVVRNAKKMAYDFKKYGRKQFERAMVFKRDSFPPERSWKRSAVRSLRTDCFPAVLRKMLPKVWGCSLPLRTSSAAE